MTVLNIPGSDLSGPRVYVGTYAKYNSGSIKGAWLDLEDYSDKDAFLVACKELHSDESDPEFMFQDYEGFPAKYYNESSISEDLWNDWISLDDDDREMLEVYQDHVNRDGTIEDAREAYMGEYDSAEAWAESWLIDTGGLESVPEHLKNYIDFEAYARDARLGGDVTFATAPGGSVWVFSNH